VLGAAYEFDALSAERESSIMPRKPLDPFRKQFHPGPDLSLPVEQRFMRYRVIGEYLLHITARGEEQCFLKPPLGIAVIGCTVFTEQGREYDVCRTWLKGEAHQAMLRLPASYGWRIAEFEKYHARWERPAPANRSFVG
jgi:hypothetical protein